MLFPILSLATAALALPSTIRIEERQSVPTTNCTKTGVHMIVARASTESPGIGALLAPVVAGIEEFLPGSDSVGVDYPALLESYASSISIGVSNTTKLVQDYVKSCPSSKIVLLGYSQGAQVIGDTICGTSSANFVETSALASTYSNNIIAIVQMGDPSHIAGIPTVDQGTSTSNGLFPRTRDTGCTQYMNRTRTYCDSGDAYCDSGLYLAPHYEYVTNYGEAAVEFVLEMAAAASLVTASEASSVAAIAANFVSTFTGFPKSTGYGSSAVELTTSAAQVTTSTVRTSNRSSTSTRSVSSASTGTVVWPYQSIIAVVCFATFLLGA